MSGPASYSRRRASAPCASQSETWRSGRAAIWALGGCRASPYLTHSRPLGARHSCNVCWDTRRLRDLGDRLAVTDHGQDRLVRLLGHAHPLREESVKDQPRQLSSISRNTGRDHPRSRLQASGAITRRWCPRADWNRLTPALGASPGVGAVADSIALQRFLRCCMPGGFGCSGPCGYLSGTCYRLAPPCHVRPQPIPHKSSTTSLLLMTCTGRSIKLARASRNLVDVTNHSFPAVRATLRSWSAASSVEWNFRSAVAAS